MVGASNEQQHPQNVFLPKSNKDKSTDIKKETNKSTDKKERNKHKQRNMQRRFFVFAFRFSDDLVLGAVEQLDSRHPEAPF